MKLFGREPTLWIAVLNSLVILIGTFGFHWISGGQAVLLVVVINALFGAVNAFAVRPISPVAFTYAIGSIVALAAAYGLNIPAESVAAVNTLVIPLLALVTRNQVSPIETALTKETNAAQPTAEALPLLGFDGRKG